MAKKTCIIRLKRELKSFMENPPPYIPAVAVNERNILEWHYLLQGPPDSPYAGGWYIGKLKFSGDYPFKPPSIMMLTPSGRFAPGTRLCLSMSDFHPESWNPMWTLSTVLTGLLSFMLESTATTGSVESSLEEKRALAADSVAFNLRSQPCRAVFPHLAQVAKLDLKPFLREGEDVEDVENVKDVEDEENGEDVDNEEEGVDVGEEERRTSSMREEGKSVGTLPDNQAEAPPQDPSTETMDEDSREDVTHTQRDLAADEDVAVQETSLGNLKVSSCRSGGGDGGSADGNGLLHPDLDDVKESPLARTVSSESWCSVHGGEMTEERSEGCEGLWSEEAKRAEDQEGLRHKGDGDAEEMSAASAASAAAETQLRGGEAGAAAGAVGLGKAQLGKDWNPAHDNIDNSNDGNDTDYLTGESGDESTDLEDDAVAAAMEELREGNPEEALAILEEVCSGASGNSEGHVSMYLCRAQAYTALGQLTEAQSMLSQVTRLKEHREAGEDTSDEAKEETRGRVAGTNSRTAAGAFEYLKEAAALKEKADRLFRKRKYKDAVGEYQHAAGLVPGCAPLLCNLAAALVAYRGGLPASPQHATTSDAFRVQKSDKSFGERNLEGSPGGFMFEALTAAEQALRTHRNYSKARLRRADCLVELGRSSEAAVEYRTLASLFPNDEDIRRKLLLCQDSIE